METLKRPFDSAVLLQVEREVERFLGAARSLRVTPEGTASEVRDRIAESFDLTAPSELETVLDATTLLLEQYQIHVFHPRYFGLFNPSVTPASVVGDLLAAVWNPQLAAWSHSPAANEMERFVLDFLMKKIGWNDEGQFANFTSGGAEANFSAVVVAMAKRIPHFREHGVAGVRPRIYVSQEAHHSFQKTAVMAALGSGAVAEIESGDDLRLDVEVLRQRLENDRADGFFPLMVVGTAGTTSGGIIDPLLELAHLCRKESLWFHVDAAWGGSALLSPRHRNHLAGIEQADSVTWDAHKWLSVPMGAGMFFCRHRDAIDGAFGISTEYMPDAWSDKADPYATTAQWSRRAIGLKLFVSLAHHGEEGYRSMIEQQTEMADLLRSLLLRGGWQIVNHTPLPVVCFTDSELRNDELRAVAANVQQRGLAWISATVLGGRTVALRACITSFATTAEDLDVLVSELELCRRDVIDART